MDELFDIKILREDLQQASEVGGLLGNVLAIRSARLPDQAEEYAHSRRPRVEFIYKDELLTGLNALLHANARPSHRLRLSHGKRLNGSRLRRISATKWALEPGFGLENRPVTNFRRGLVRRPGSVGDMVQARRVDHGLTPYGRVWHDIVGFENWAALALNA